MHGSEKFTKLAALSVLSFALLACGGGTGDQSANQENLIPPTNGGSTETPTSNLSIKQLQTDTPYPRQAFRVEVNGFNNKTPFTITVSQDGFNFPAQYVANPYNTQELLLAMPVYITNTQTFSTKSYIASIKIEQDNQTVTFPVQVLDLPTLEDMGLPLGRPTILNSQINITKIGLQHNFITTTSACRPTNCVGSANLTQSQINNLLETRSKLIRNHEKIIAIATEVGSTGRTVSLNPAAAQAPAISPAKLAFLDRLSGVNILQHYADQGDTAVNTNIRPSAILSNFSSKATSIKAGAADFYQKNRIALSQSIAAGSLYGIDTINETVRNLNGQYSGEKEEATGWHGAVKGFLPSATAIVDNLQGAKEYVGEVATVISGIGSTAAKEAGQVLGVFDYVDGIANAGDSLAYVALYFTEDNARAKALALQKAKESSLDAAGNIVGLFANKINKLGQFADKAALGVLEAVEYFDEPQGLTSYPVRSLINQGIDNSNFTKAQVPIDTTSDPTKIQNQVLLTNVVPDSTGSAAVSISRPGYVNQNNSTAAVTVMVPKELASYCTTSIIKSDTNTLLGATTNNSCSGLAKPVKLLACTSEGGYSGTFDGGDTGTFNATITGLRITASVNSADQGLISATGSLSATGRVNIALGGSVSSGARFAGALTSSSGRWQMGGTWVSQTGEIGGSFLGFQNRACTAQ